MRKRIFTLFVVVFGLIGVGKLQAQCTANGGTIQANIGNVFCPGDIIGASICGFDPESQLYLVLTDLNGNVITATNHFNVIGACATGNIVLPDNTCNECFNLYGYSVDEPFPVDFPTVLTPGNCGSICCDLSLAVTVCAQDFDGPTTEGFGDVINLECDAEIEEFDPISFDTLEVIDNCSNPRISFAYDFVTGVGCPDDPKRVERVFNMIDQCGNTSEYRQIFRFLSPVLSLDCSTIPVACFEDITHAPEIIVDTLGCGVTYDIDFELVRTVEVGGPHCDLTCYHFEYEVTDDCGQFATCTKIYVILNDGPSFEGRAPKEIDDLMEEDTTILQCNPFVDDEIEAWLNSKVASGFCPSDTILDLSNTFDPEGFVNGCGAGNTGEQLVTFYAEDACGRMDSCLAVLVLIDTLPPNQKQIAMDYCISCSDGDAETMFNDWINDNGGARAVDYCGSVSWTTDPVDPDFFIACTPEEGGIDVTFIASDDCGNTLTTTANFKVINDGPPTVDTEAMDMEVDCTDDFQSAFEDWLANNGGAEVTGCGTIVWTFDPPDAAANLDICDNDGGTMVTFTATDECNQSVSSTATFSVSDSGAPVLTDAMDLELDCSTDPMAAIDAWLGNNGGATATDDCSDVIWTNDFDGLMEDCPGSGSATVTLQLLMNVEMPVQFQLL